MVAWRQETRNKSIPEDENIKITSAEALKKLDEIKNFMEVNHLNMIFNELNENVEKMKLKSKKQSKVSLDLEIYFIYTVYSYGMNKFSILISVVFSCQKNPKLCIADTRL